VALFRGGEQLVELRRASQLRPHGIVLQSGVGAKVAGDGILEQPQSEVLMPAKQEVGGDHVTGLGVGIGKKTGGRLVCLGVRVGWRFVEETGFRILARSPRDCAGLRQVALAQEVPYQVRLCPARLRIELKKIQRPFVVAQLVEGKSTRPEW